MGVNEIRKVIKEGILKEKGIKGVILDAIGSGILRTGGAFLVSHFLWLHMSEAI